MNNLPLLSIIILLPIIASIIIFLLPKKNDKTILSVALIFSSLVFIVLLLILFKFETKLYPNTNNIFQFAENFTIIDLSSTITDALTINYAIGIDGISLIFIFFTVITIPFLFLTINGEKEKLKSNIFLTLLLSSTLIGLFTSTDLLCFYVFFEITYLILFLLIKNQNSIKTNKRFSFSFYLHIFSSLIFLIFIWGLNQSSHEILDNGYVVNSFNLSTFYQISNYTPDGILSPFNPNNLRVITFIFLVIALIIKIFVLPFRYFLKENNHFIVIISQILIAKVGFYILIKIIIPIFSELIPLYFHIIANVGIVLFALFSIKIILTDSLNKFIINLSFLYFSMIFVGIGLNTNESIVGAIQHIFNHSIIFLGLFYCLYLYKKEKSLESFREKSISIYIRIFPIILLFALIAFPGLSSFTSQYLILKSILINYHIIIFIVTLIAIILIFFKAINLVKVENKILIGFTYSTKIIRYEYIILIPILSLIIYLGICPNYIIKIISTFIHYFVQ
ncbi:MAG: hypothetical protein JXA68_02570 [Ignavibacteriales bacterium]|nr:hypothetical protein [Ignavibacteriales bacterium]